MSILVAIIAALAWPLVVLAIAALALRRFDAVALFRDEVDAIRAELAAERKQREDGDASLNGADVLAEQKRTELEHRVSRIEGRTAHLKG